MLCLTVESSFFSALQTSQVHPNSIYAQPKQEPILLQHSTQTQVVLEKRVYLCRVYQVNIFYPKTINKQQGKNGRETFREQILIQKIVNFLSRCEKRTSFLHARDHVVDA